MGLEIITKEPGDQRTYPKNGQRVDVHYTGALSDGTVFDTSKGRNKPFTFEVGREEVVKGMDEGIKQMSVGETAIIKCSEDLAYGKRGYPGVIPAYSTLIFEIKLVAIK